MEYSSTKKSRLPGISFDFDDDDSSDSDDQSNNTNNYEEKCMFENKNDEDAVITPPVKKSSYDGFASYRYNISNTNDDDGGNGNGRIIGEEQNATPNPNDSAVIQSSSSATEATPNNNNNSNNAAMNTKKSASKSIRSSSCKKKRSKSESVVLSPTTMRLHETANLLVDSAEESTLDKIDDGLANVVESVLGVFAFGSGGGSSTGGKKNHPKSDKNAGGGEKKNQEEEEDGEMQTANINDSEQSSTNNGVVIRSGNSGSSTKMNLCRANETTLLLVRSEESGNNANDAEVEVEVVIEMEGGEQQQQQQQPQEKTEVLDASAAYLARMERQYNSNNLSDNDHSVISNSNIEADDNNGKCGGIGGDLTTDSWGLKQQHAMVAKESERSDGGGAAGDVLMEGPNDHSVISNSSGYPPTTTTEEEDHNRTDIDQQQQRQQLLLQQQQQRVDDEGADNRWNDSPSSPIVANGDATDHSIDPQQQQQAADAHADQMKMNQADDKDDGEHDNLLNETTNKADQSTCSSLESFYIGREEGFLTSESVHESDISETASEGGEDVDGDENGNGEDGDGDGNDENVGEDSQEDVEDSMLLLDETVDQSRHVDDDDDDSSQCANGTVVDEQSQCANDETMDESANATASEKSRPATAVGNGLVTTKDITNAVMQHPSEIESNITDVEAATAAVTSSMAGDGSVTIADSKTPTKLNHIDQDDANESTQQHDNDSEEEEEDDDFVPSSIKEILLAQEMELHRMLSSIDALSSTPARIARECTEDRMEEDDCCNDSGMDEMMQFSGDRLSSGRGMNGYGGKMSGCGLSPVKKRLVLGDNDTPATEKGRLDPLLAEERHEVPSVEKGAQKLEEKKIEAPVPQSPAIVDEYCPHFGMINLPSVSVTAPSVATSLFDVSTATSSSPFSNRPPEPVSSPPMNSSCLSNDNDNSAHPEQEEADLSMSHQSGEKDVEAANLSVSSPTEEALEQELASLEPHGEESATPKSSQEVMPPSLTDQHHATAADKQVNQDKFIHQLADDNQHRAIIDERVEENKQVGQDAADEEEAEEDDIPDSIQQLFRDADSILQSVLASPVLKGGGSGNRAELDGDGGAFCDDYIRPSSSSSFAASTSLPIVESGNSKEALSLEGTAAEAERRADKERMAAAAEQAELERLERERSEHERALAVQRQVEKESRLVAEAEAERAEKERLEAVAVKQAELERIEHERALAVQRREDKEEEARLLSEAKHAEAEQVKKERLAVEAAKQAEFDRLERERVEHERALAEHRQVEEEAHLLSEAKKASAEQVKKEWLAVEAVKQAEFDRLERERVEHERTFAAQQQNKEAERVEKERFASEAVKQAALESSSPITDDNSMAYPALDSLRGAFLAAESKLESAAATPTMAPIPVGKEGHDSGGESEENISLDELVVTSSLSLDNNGVGGGDSSLANDDTFDTAFCSLGGIERALDDFFDAKERIEDYNNVGAAATASEEFADAPHNNTVGDSAPSMDDNEQVDALVTMYGHGDRKDVTTMGEDGNDFLEEAEESIRVQHLKQSHEVNDVDDHNTTGTVEKRFNTSATNNAEMPSNQIAGKTASETLFGLEGKKIDDATEAAAHDDSEMLTESMSNQLLLADNDNQDVAVEDEIDILDRVDSYIKNLRGGMDVTEKWIGDEASEPPLKINGVSSAVEGVDMSVETSVEMTSVPAAQNDHVRLESNNISAIKTDSRPSTGNASATGRSNSGASDESMMNESMFMPNMSLDITSTSPELKEVFPADTSEPLLPMSEDESESDDEDFFPNRDLTLKSKSSATTSANKKSILEKEHKPRVSISHVPSCERLSSIIATTSKLASKETAYSSAASKRNDRQRKISSATLKRRSRLSSVVATSSTSQQANGRKAAPPPRSSPPSNMKPAKKRSKSLLTLNSPSEKDLGENNNDKSLSLMDMSLNITMENIAVVVGSTPTPATGQIGESATILPSQVNKHSIRQMRVESSKSTVVTRGKENNKVESTTAKGKSKTTDAASSSRSLKQSLVSMTRSRRRQSETMKRLERLAQPRRQSMARPTNHSPGRSVKQKGTKGTASGPPSLLSRTAPSRHTVKSTAELEEEEMEHIKPFKAQKIRGRSTAVKSRFKTATPCHRPPARFASSSSNVTELDHHKPAAVKPPSFLSRESSLYKPTPTRKRIHTFGETMQQYLNHGLRDSLPSSTKESKSTPKPPSFLHRQTLSHHSSTATKSSEEIELKECRKQFHARPLPARTRCYTQVRRMTPQQRRDEPRMMLTMPSPFKLRTTLREGARPPVAPSTDDVELAKPFRALPLPGNASTTRLFNSANNDTPYHIRAQQQYELAKERKERLIEEEYYGKLFKAKPVPKTTYVARPEKSCAQARPLTRPKPPRLSLASRAEERKLFDQHTEGLRSADVAMEQMREQQQKEIEEKEIRRQRSLPAEKGGFCFKANDVVITYQ